MKFDFESLSTEPLFYMLMHSGAFVCVLGGIFFFIGLLFGYATWGRFKRQTRLLQAEASSMKDEIASLKRKVGELSILSGPAIPMATETIFMPKKEDPPAVTGETLATPDSPQPSALALAPAAPAAENTTATKDASPPDLTPSVSADPPAESPEPAPEAPSLAASLSTPPDKEKQETSADADTSAPAPSESSASAGILPPLTELLLPALPELESQPQLERKPEPPRDSELHPKLGFIYKTRPEKTDDLTVIESISPVLEKRLQALGIYTYGQIAAWDDDHVKEFSSRLAFKDRLKRERWVEQARELAIKQTTTV